jgi:glycogen debranching enzyme
MTNNTTLLRKAHDIALSSLRSCYSKEGIFAGLHQFSDCWARDSLFSSWGALAIGDYAIVRKNLSLFLRNQHRNGQIPLRVGDYFIALKVLGINLRQSLKPRYSQDKYFSYPTDQNSLLIITCLEYLKTTKDKAFILENYDRLKKALRWNLRQDKDNDLLMEEGFYASWADSLRKKGKVLYTNVLFFQALASLSALSARLGRKQDSLYYSSLAKRLREKINQAFWNGRYYSDWIDAKRYDYFSTDGNLLAILSGLADRKQGLSIQRCIEDFRLNEPPTKTNYPSYPSKLLSHIDSWVGIGDYHNGMSWLWLGCLDVVCKRKLGLKAESHRLLSRISGTIIRHNGVYEVYEPDGKPVSRLIYRAEQPFAWSSGLYLWAYEKMA